MSFENDLGFDVQINDHQARQVLEGLNNYVERLKQNLQGLATILSQEGSLTSAQKSDFGRSASALTSAQAVQDILQRSVSVGESGGPTQGTHLADAARKAAAWVRGDPVMVGQAADPAAFQMGMYDVSKIMRDSGMGWDKDTAHAIIQQMNGHGIPLNRTGMNAVDQGVVGMLSRSMNGTGATEPYDGSLLLKLAKDAHGLTGRSYASPNAGSSLSRAQVEDVLYSPDGFGLDPDGLKNASAAVRATRVAMRDQQHQFSSFLKGSAVALGIGMSDAVSVYSNEILSGRSDAVGHVRAMGELAGGFVGAGIGKVVGGAFAGPIFAATGAHIAGSIGSMLMAPSVHYAQAVSAAAPYAAAAGVTPESMVLDINRMSAQYNTAQQQNDVWGGGGFSVRGAFRSFFREVGMYPGADRADIADVTSAKSTMQGMFMNMGWGLGGVDGSVNEIMRRYGGGAAAEGVIKSIAPAAARMADVYGNPFSLAMSVGPATAAGFFNAMMPGQVDTAGLVAGVRAVKEAAYAARLPEANAAIDLTTYQAATLSGKAAWELGGEKGALAQSLGSAASALDAKLAAIRATPGGRGSAEEAEAVSAVAQARLRGYEFNNQYAMQLAGDYKATANLRNANIGVEATRVGLYSMNPADIGRVIGAEGASISAQQTDIRGVIAGGGLTYEQKTSLQTVLKELEAQKVGLPAKEALQRMSLRDLVTSPMLAAASAGITTAALYGTDGRVSGSYDEMSTALRQRVSDIDATLADQGLDKASRSRLTGERSGVMAQITQNRANKAGSLMARSEDAFGLSEGDKAFDLHRAQALGTGRDVVKNVGGYISELNKEDVDLEGRLKSGELSHDQEVAAKKRRQEIRAQKFDIQNNMVEEVYHKDDLAGYSLEEMRLGNLAKRARALPYGPGNVYGIELLQMQSRSRRISQLRGREEELRGRHQLSPERYYDLESQIEGLGTENVMSMATLTEGIEDRMPALSANAPAGFARHNSRALAAYQLMAINSPIRSFGANGGAQQNYQNAVAASMGVMDPTPHSRTADLNSGDAAGTLKNIERLLEKLASTGASFQKGSRGPGDLGPQAGRTPSGHELSYN